jgi:acetyltransferase-like isoleucine patch superfamily enzyme
MVFKILSKCYHLSAFLAAVPFSLMTKFIKFVYVAELISLLPFRIGEHIRYYFYKSTLASCGDDIVISFGSIISYPSVTIGNHVWIGAFNIFGNVDIGDYTLTAQCCHFLSGSQHHGIDDIETPIRYQPGIPGRINIGPDIWVGTNSTIMANIGKGCVIGAGSVVTKDIPDYSVAAGNPARIIRNRK